ncbi:NAD(P)/FAD-dependent oxidoreductase [Parasediminibacterium sp. JCM 36343]|uniref:NAD(P)/FAD-dependent oxidoreductase n=1 Tax=Parasediminibacterium sp. JCM 36343 TaxID=3374279 RepID=UPI0039788AA7
MALEKLHSTVCIIGAGPAGASTSIFLSKLGIEHIIIDGATFPRDKVCGDGLDMKSIRMLNHIDPNIIPNEIMPNPNFTPSWGMRYITTNGKNIDFAYKPPAGKENECPFFITKRFYFDNFLIQKINSATALFRQGTIVKTIAKEGADWKIIATSSTGEVEITCQMLVGADGDHSTLLRYLGDRKINREHYASSVRQYWKNVAGTHPDNLLEFYYAPNIPMGYFWIFPLGNGEANVGYGITSSIASKQHLNVRNTFAELIEKDPALSHRFKYATPIAPVEGWGIPLASLKRKVVGDGWLLVGDAASMVSPNTGEGIGTGMMTGYIAAKFIDKGIKAKSFSEGTLANYSREVFKRMEQEIKSYEFNLRHPGITNTFMGFFVRDNFICRIGFNYIMKGWLKTAYQKEVTVNLD